MKKNFGQKNFGHMSTLVVLGFVTALSAIGCASAPAQTAPQSLITGVTMTTSSTITQGEPIVLHYRVTNTGSKELAMGISMDETRFLTQSIEDTGGNVTAGKRPVDANSTDDQTGLFNGGIIASHSTLTGDVVTNQWFHSLAPGTYTLSVQTSISYGDADQVAQTVPYTKVRDFRQDREDFQFRVVITPAVPSRLQATAQRLEQEIVQQPAWNTPQRKLLLGELFSLPEAQALPSWKKIAASPLSSWALSDVVDNLMHIKTAATAGILIDMIVSQSQKPYADIYINSSLVSAMAVTYRDGDPILQQHIRTLYASRGLPLAEIVGVPGRTGKGN